MKWFDPGDRSEPVLEPRKQIESKYPGMKVPVLPPRAVVFCLGRGMPVTKEHYPCFQIMEQLPGFITHSEVIGVEGNDGVCFLHGGYAAPQMACTVETLRVLGVKEMFLVGLCGGFAEGLAVGDLLLPEKVLSEEGVSRHYMEDPGFARVTPPDSFAGIDSCFREKGYRVFRDAVVTTDAAYRQTYRKEQGWRELGCAGVDMETSAMVNLCNLYGIRNAAALMVSDVHPVREGDFAWKWGGEGYAGKVERFILDCDAFSLGKQRDGSFV